MPIYKQNESGKFVPFEQTPFPDLEKVLEDWIEASPHVVLNEEIAIFARQQRTSYDKYLDLLGIDKTGAVVVIELKRGETPRDVVAQTLEYAAWVDSLTLDQLDELARDYSATHQIEAEGLAELYNQRFSVDSDEDEQDGGAAERVTFNNRQRLVIVAERISDEVEQTLRYLRTRYSVDVHGVEFSVHKAGEDTIINTTTIVGRERPSKSSQPSQARERESDEHILAKVKTEFMRRAVTAIEEWVDGLGVSQLVIQHSTGSEHYMKHLGVTWLYYYYANNWVYMTLDKPNEEEVDTLRSRLSKPDEVWTRDGWTAWRFHVASDDDLEVVKEVILNRLGEQGQGLSQN